MSLHLDNVHLPEVPLSLPHSTKKLQDRYLDVSINDLVQQNLTDSFLFGEEIYLDPDLVSRILKNHSHSGHNSEKKKQAQNMQHRKQPPCSILSYSHISVDDYQEKQPDSKKELKKIRFHNKSLNFNSLTKQEKVYLNQLKELEMKKYREEADRMFGQGMN